MKKKTKLVKISNDCDKIETIKTFLAKIFIAALLEHVWFLKSEFFSSQVANSEVASLEGFAAVDDLQIDC